MLQDLFPISILYRPTNFPPSLPGLTAHCLHNAQSHSHGPLGSFMFWSWTISPVFHLVLPALYFLLKCHLTFSYRTVSSFRTSVIGSILTASSRAHFSPHFLWLEPDSYSLTSVSLHTLLLPQSFPGSLSCHLLSLIT